MKMRELLEDAREELDCEIEQAAKEELKERLREIMAVEDMLEQMKSEFQILLNSDVSETVFDD